MGLFRGFFAPLRGAIFMARYGLLGYLVLPLLLNAGLAVLTVWLGLHFVRGWMGTGLFASWPTLSGVLLVLAACVGGILLFVLLQPVVGAPFVDLVSEKTETVVRGHAPSIGLWRAATLSVLHGLSKAALYAFALAVVLVLGAVSGIGGALGIVLYAVFFAFDGFDYPLSRRGFSFGEKWGYLVRHPAQTTGFCVGATVLYLVPLAALVAPTLLAVGATLAYLDAEPRRPKRQRPPP
jgi:uncharacterized protein involved in cysteine biosynthesis